MPTGRKDFQGTVEEDDDTEGAPAIDMASLQKPPKTIHPNTEAVCESHEDDFATTADDCLSGTSREWSFLHKL